MPISPGKGIPFARVNPLTKLALLAWSATLAFVLPTTAAWLSTAAILAMTVAVGLGHRLILRFLLLCLPFFLAVFLFNGLILPAQDAVPLVGPLTFSPKGLVHAGAIAARIGLLMSSALLFLATTPPETLLQALDTAGYPPGLSYLLASPILLIGQFRARVRAIQDAQRTRGLNVQGRIRDRFRGLLMLLVPVVTTALMEADQRAHLLAARGFRSGPRRTVLSPPPDSLLQKRLRLVLGVASIVQLGLSPWL